MMQIDPNIVQLNEQDINNIIDTSFLNVDPMKILEIKQELLAKAKELTWGEVQLEFDRLRESL